MRSKAGSNPFPFPSLREGQAGRAGKDRKGQERAGRTGLRRRARKMYISVLYLLMFKIKKIKNI
jgi:hypothetical protein